MVPTRAPILAASDHLHNPTQIFNDLHTFGSPNSTSKIGTAADIPWKVDLTSQLNWQVKGSNQIKSTKMDPTTFFPFSTYVLRKGLMKYE